MSTINNSSQTLFRFVSLRNPQLTETKDNPGFVVRPENTSSVFSSVETWNGSSPKFQKLEELAIAFEPQAFKTEAEVEAFTYNFYQLGKSIAKKEDVSSVNISTMVLPSHIDMGKLWDNLIYQVVTQKDFYVKESIIQTLKAIHYVETKQMIDSDISRYSNAYEIIAKALEAKVVLPSTLFQDGNSEQGVSPFQVNVSKISNGVISGDLPAALQHRLQIKAQEDIKITEAKLKKEALLNLKSQVEKLQKAYAKSYYKAYNNAYTAYKQQIQPEINRYETAVNNVESQFTDQTTEAEKQTAYQSITPINVPEFSFSYKNEVNFTDLQAKTSEKSLGLFLNLFTEFDETALQTNTETNRTAGKQILSDTEMSVYGTSVVLNEDYQNYNDILAKLEEEIAAQSNVILSSEVLPQQQYKNVGGVLVPVSTDKSNVQHLLYTLNPYSSSEMFWGYGALNFNFEVADASWSVASAKITATTRDADMNNFNYEQNYSQIPVVNNTITLPSIFTSSYDMLSSIKIEIFFDNGRESVLELQNISSNNVQYGYLELKSVGNTGGTSSFAPKHFGVKRLGVADYLKVEQSLHAYVPGEVSNIENVMASELRQKNSTRFTSSEVTDSKGKSIEKEHISDTTTATRNEMQSEVAHVLQQDTNAEAHRRNSISTSEFGVTASVESGGSFSYHRAKEDSTRQAVTKAQEITNHALDRVVSKVTEERVVKIINQFTENNTHEFDNRGTGAQHIAGVYRWVDKKMKNQIYNYGKRAMFEFMIPEPAKLHRLANVGEILTAPIDPRTAEVSVAIKTYNDVTEEKLKYWKSIYPELEFEFYQMNKEIPFTKLVQDWSSDGRCAHSAEFNLSIPTNYKLDSIIGSVKVMQGNSPACFGNMHSTTYIAGKETYTSGYQNQWQINLDYSTGAEVSGDINVTNTSWDIGSFNYSLMLNCSIIPSFLEEWKVKSFDLLIKKYNEANTAFLQKKAEIEAQQKDKTQNFYRDMEEVVLKHNCIAYLLQDFSALGNDQLIDAKNTMMKDFKVNFGDDLDQYTALCKFMEQAFEWNIMSYTFYPYYWGNKNDWKDLYTTESIDPLFRNFLQAGMARVIVTVKPGFEDAVQFFMNTGRIWNGGEVPVIGDPLYLSIVDELREPTGKPQGKAWITRIPTTLNILQAKSIGLEVTDALPVFPENPNNFEDQKDVEMFSPFGAPKDIVLLGSGKESTLPKEVTRVIVRK